MKLVITGGCGFIGSSISIHLKKKYPHYRIIAFDNLKRRGSELNVNRLYENDIEFIHGDIRNNEDLASLEEFDLLIDASAEPSVLSGLNGNPDYVIQNNFLGTINCLNTCLKYNAGIIFLSTSRVYPIEKIENAIIIESEDRFDFSSQQTTTGISDKGISEMLDLQGYRSFYGATKLASELLIQEYEQFYQLNACITRFGVVAGPHQMGKTDQGVATLWLSRHYFKQPLSYIGYGGKGKQVRDILHVDDLVELIDLQIHQPHFFKGKTFNAGGGIENSIALNEMTLLCQQITGNRVAINSEIETRKADLKNYTSDISRITSETPWKPKRNLETIFGDIHNWIRENESQIKSFIGK
jgi:CDP-paratose 2-epimerase